ncbi:MAG: hypothetical protein QF894_00465 [Alphaproteobacteria bacterium]|nr:hypothetical protein [Alphaproteobacteria bacterium]
MRAKAMLLVVAVLALLLHGCSGAIRRDGIPPTDLSTIVTDTDRATVEEVLGSPIASVATETGRIDTYRYDMGLAPQTTRGSPARATGIFTHPGVLLLVLLGAVVAQPVLVHNLYEDQKGELSITYGPDDKVVSVETAGQRASRELQEDLSVIQVGATRAQVEEVLGEPDYSDSDRDGTKQVYRHQRGSARVVMYVTYGPEDMITRAETASQLRQRQQRELREDLSVVQIGATREQVEGALGAPDHSESGENGPIHVYRHPWGSTSDAMHVTYGPDGKVTRAETARQLRQRDERQDMADLQAKAQCGDARAQFKLGSQYWTGSGVTKDFARSYFWYGVANAGGVGAAPSDMPNLSKRLSAEQIAETERRIAEWQPEDCPRAANMVTTEEVIENQ